MAKEREGDKRRRALSVLRRLDEHMPQARIELDYRTPLELLVAVMLSAQCTDKRVNLVTPALFARFPDARAYAEASPDELEPYIRTCGLFRSKAKNLVAAAQALVAEHGGQVPLQRDALEKLPGVGHKTAGVVSAHLGGDEAFPVDTHIRRLSRRLGFTSESDPDRIEECLRALVPSEWWMKGHQLLIWHGRRTCLARVPACDRCVVNALCPKIGVRLAAAGSPPVSGRRRRVRRPVAARVRGKRS